MVDPGTAALLAGGVFGVGGVGGFIGYYIKAHLDRNLAAEARAEERAVAAKKLTEAVTAAGLEQQWRNAHAASEWVVSSDPATRRLGVAHLYALRDTWTNDKTVRAFVETTIRAALVPTIQQVPAYGGSSTTGVVQAPAAPPPQLSAP